MYIDYENANSGKVTIAGGSITDNVGGGLYLAERTMNITGAPVISRNTAGSAEQNVYLAQSTYLELSSLAEGMYVAITAADASETAKVATVTGSGYKTGMLRSDANNRMLDPDTNGSTLLNLVPRKTASVGTDNYTDMQAAVTAAGTTTTIVVGKEMENASVRLPATSGSEAVKLDLNGNDIGKNVHLSSEGTTTLYLADSNLEYNSTEPTKVLKSAISNKVTVSREHKVDNKRYVVLDAGKYYEVHRVQVSITARTLRPTNNGVGFQVKFSAAESIPDSYLKGFGLSFAVKNGNGEVVTGNYEPKMDLLTDYDQKLVNEKTLTIVIKDFLSENIQWAEYTVIGTPFIKLDDGTTVEVEGTPVEVSFRQMVEYANTNFEDLNPVQQKAIARMMYSKETFTTLLSGWNTGNIKAFAQANGFVQK